MEGGSFPSDPFSPPSGSLEPGNSDGRPLDHTVPKASPGPATPLLGRSLLLSAPFSEPFHLTSLAAQLVKNLPAMWETRVSSLGWEDPWRRERLPTPVFWPGEFHGLYRVHGVTKSPTRLSDFHFHEEAWPQLLLSWGARALSAAGSRGPVGLGQYPATPPHPPVWKARGGTGPLLRAGR